MEKKWSDWAVAFPLQVTVKVHFTYSVVFSFVQCTIFDGKFQQIVQRNLMAYVYEGCKILYTQPPCQQSM